MINGDQLNVVKRVLRGMKRDKIQAQGPRKKTGKDASATAREKIRSSKGLPVKREAGARSAWKREGRTTNSEKGLSEREVIRREKMEIGKQIWHLGSGNLLGKSMRMKSDCQKECPNRVGGKTMNMTGGNTTQGTSK